MRIARRLGGFCRMVAGVACGFDLYVNRLDAVFVCQEGKVITARSHDANDQCIHRSLALLPTVERRRAIWQEPPEDDSRCDKTIPICNATALNVKHRRASVPVGKSRHQRLCTN